MKVPFSWLSEYVELDGLSPQEVADQLSMGAFEVEEVRKFGGGIEGPVVVGEILEINPVPKTTKVRMTKVKVDPSSEPLEIVCGAQNIEVGQIIPVALPGSTVINRKDGTAFPIKVAPIYGVVSNGMLCSPPELGLTGGESEGILIFEKSKNYKLGQDVKALLSLESDHILHVSPRSNRGDALSIRGLAREVAALTKRPLKVPEWSLAEQADSKVKKFNTKIENIEDCELFTIRSIGNITIGESPTLIKRRLEAVGIRSINNVVDITNYVMHELGQSLHAYDAGKLIGQSFFVRRAKEGERIKAIDGKERKLTSEVLVIADEKNLVGIAGIMGGLDSEVGDSTKEIALEAASFQPARVRRGTRLLGLHSEASLRFERGVDVNSAITASDRASYLISKYCCGAQPVAIGPLTYDGSEVKELPKVSLRLNQIERLLDISLTADEIVTMLKPLGFTRIEDGSKAGETINFAIPSYRRRDVTREIDLIEEICRIYGYERLPQSMPKATVAPGNPEDTPSEIRIALSGQGLSEAWISSLVPPESDSELEANQFHFGTQNSDSIVSVLNPLSKDHQVLRQSLIPGLLEAVKYNVDHGEKDIWLFEIGRAYFARKSKQAAIESKAGAESPVVEKAKVAAVLMGNPALSKWTEVIPMGQNHQNGGSASGEPLAPQKDELNFYQAKGVVENLFSHLRIDLDRIAYSSAQSAPAVMHPGKCARIDLISERDGSPATQVGWLGEIHPSCADKLGLDFATYAFELDMETLTKMREAPVSMPIMTSPVVSRDLTIDLPKDADNAAVVACIKGSAGNNFKGIELVSKFPLSNELKSLSYRLTFQHPEQTLRSEEVDQELTKIRTALQNQLGASFRA